MVQVKQSQIITEEYKNPNPALPTPRDLAVNATTETVNDINSNSVVPNNDSVSVPQAPAILSVKEQIVNFNADGSAKIDLILEIQDVDSAVEYDIRVTKGAGNL